MHAREKTKNKTHSTSFNLVSYPGELLDSNSLPCEERLFIPLGPTPVLLLFCMLFFLKDQTDQLTQRCV